MKKTLSEFLDKQIHIYQSTDYKTAINQLDDHAIDVILINDFSPPHSLQLLEKLFGKYPNMPIIVLADVMDADMARQALTAGALDYLVKAHETPFLLAHSIRFTRQLKKSQNQLQRITSNFENAQRTAHLGSWEIDLKTRKGSWSDEFYRICGLEPGSITATAENGLQLIHPDDRERVRSAIQQAIENKQRYEVIKRIVRPDGEVRYVLSQGDIITDREHESDRLVGSFLDITERVLVEKELENIDAEVEERVAQRTSELKKSRAILKGEVRARIQTQELLRQENEFITTVLDTISALVVVLDENGNMVGFNRAAEQATGYSAIDVYGKSAWEYFLPENEVETAKTTIDNLSIEHPSNTYQGHWLTREGTSILIDWINTVLFDESGKIKYIICSGIDITDSTRLQEAGSRHMLDLFHMSRLSTMGEMATEIAHELNQPLAAIASFSETCQRLLNQDNWQLEDIATTLKEINLQAARAGDIIRELRIFASKKQAHRSSVDINQLIKNVAHLIEVETRYHGISLQMNLAESLPLIMANKVLIEQVILNLVRNAIEAMTQSKTHNQHMKITVKTTKNDMVKVSISDTGPGISPKSISRIFESFYTTKEDGTGMGLSICKSIISNHGGELWVTNNLDGGANFHFSLPINNEDD